MLLIVLYLLRFEHIPVQQLLQLDKGSCFMAADISQVIRAAAANGKRLGILEFLHVYLIVRRITVVFYPEGNRLEQLVVFDQLYIANSMDFLSPANYFVSPIGIYIFNKVR